MKTFFGLKVNSIIFFWLASITLLICTAFPYVGSSHWISAPCASFRLQCAIASVALAATALFLQQKFGFFLLTAIIALNNFELSPQLMGQKETVTDSSELRVMLSNLNSANSSYKVFVDHVKEIDPDLLLLEEVTSEWLSNMKEIKKRYPYHHNVPREDNFGIALYSKFPLENAQTKYFSPFRLPSIVATIKIGSKKLHFIGTHPVPPLGSDYFADRNEHLKQVSTYCASLPDTNQVLLVGDLNTSPWSSYFKELINISGLKDTSIGYGLQFSWPTGLESFYLLTAIDHCLVSKNVAVVNRFIGKDIGSDHYPLIVDFSL